ncbi:MAG: hypothetical protein C4K47_08880 [Candidatus Thorarchaeota archaeon]|nr:MAG: hypothetical protein C4K47_08880 [Candidatus Thorarchaeota archaeon]
MSESELPIELEFEGGLVLTGVLDRILGPLIIEEIKYRLPIAGKAAVIAGQVKITLGLKAGNLKASTEVKQGDLAYNPLGDSLDIYLKDMHTAGRVNIVGRITSGKDALERLAGLRRGARVTVRSASQPKR